MVFVLISTETELKENSPEDFDLYKEMILALNDSVFELILHKWLFVLLFLTLFYIYITLLSQFIFKTNIRVSINLRHHLTMLFLSIKS